MTVKTPVGHNPVRLLKTLSYSKHKEKQNMLKILTAILISGILMIDISSVDTKEVDVIICLKQKWRNVYRSQRYEVQSQTMVIRYP